MPEKNDRPEQLVLTAILEEIKDWIRNKRYGNIQINFYNGVVVNINRNESIQMKKN